MSQLVYECIFEMHLRLLLVPEPDSGVLMALLIHTRLLDRLSFGLRLDA